MTCSWSDSPFWRGRCSLLRPSAVNFSSLISTSTQRSSRGGLDAERKQTRYCIAYSFILSSCIRHQAWHIIHHTSFIMHHTAFIRHHPPSIKIHSSCPIHHSSCISHHSSSIIHHASESSCIAQHSCTSCITHKSSSTTHQMLFMNLTSFIIHIASSIMQQHYISYSDS